MTDVAIRAENLSKQFHIGAHRNKKNLREAIIDGFSAPFKRVSKVLRRNNPGVGDFDETIWALKDLSFEIHHGEVVGIIGPNGSGKSTLLKIFAHITEPTEGFAEVQGRLASLLEVGTGFHPELSGRENIYLNGAILGMKRNEIDRKFDEIVDFAEVEKFIDTPVKHYSSGMYLRLAFAVAAHLEPDILLVDEVLAVGDARFQKKCLEKMEDVRDRGRTVLFVSHNMGAITRLCNRVLFLEKGHLIDDGPAAKVVRNYLRAGQDTTASREWTDPSKAPGGEIAVLRAVRLLRDNGEIAETVDIRKPVTLEMEYDVIKPGYELLPHFVFWHEEGVLAFTTFDLDPAWQRKPRSEGHYLSRVLIPGNFLSEGTYFINAAIITQSNIVQFWEREVISFMVIDSTDGDSARGAWMGQMRGAVRPILHWTTECTEKEV